jgi:hypothetical protein
MLIKFAKRIKRLLPYVYAKRKTMQEEVFTVAPRSKKSLALGLALDQQG